MTESRVKPVNQDIEIQNILKAQIFNQGILKDFDAKQIQKWFSNPEEYKEELEKLAMYHYVSNGEVFQLFDLLRTLPTLEYKINCLEKDENYDKNCLKCKKTMKFINHKELTRDILTQLSISGTLTGIWVGKTNNPYLMIFDNLEYFFPAYRKNGQWVVWCDLSYFDGLNEIDRKAFIESLHPYVTQDIYEAYKKDPEKVRYLEFPIERSVCLRTHTMKRGQRFGLPWSTQSTLSVMHKKKLQDLEKAVANKIINAVAILTMGNKELPNDKISTGVKSKVYGSVRNGLEQNQTNGITVIGLPDWANLEFQNSSKEPLDPNKFESVDEDISNSLGYAKGIITGDKGNYASNKLSLEILYRKISELLENIECEVYDKLLAIILPKKISENYSISYNKAMPLSNKEKIDTLFKLETQGYSIKPLIEIIGENYEEYINQSIYEIEELELRNKIIPPLSTYTQSGSYDNGRPLDESGENNQTVISKEKNTNSNPKSEI
ncbi:hypothetical protein ACSW9O_16100 (plasmid) [Clostridium perfringens]